MNPAPKAKSVREWLPWSMGAEALVALVPESKGPRATCSGQLTTWLQIHAKEMAERLKQDHIRHTRHL